MEVNFALQRPADVDAMRQSRLSSAERDRRSGRPSLAASAVFIDRRDSESGSDGRAGANNRDLPPRSGNDAQAPRRSTVPVGIVG